MQHSNKYIFIYSIVMVVLVAIALTIVAIQLKPAQLNNIRVEKMQNILTSVHIASTPKNAEALFNKYIVNSYCVSSTGKRLAGKNAFDVKLEVELKKKSDNRALAVFEAKLDNGSLCYVMPVRGKGLWGPIWGYIALQSDVNTVYGVMFDHKGETPGLGAEINTPGFMNQFKEKQIFDETGKFISVEVNKKEKDDGEKHAVDAISGGTITSVGLSNMVFDCLKEYEAFFNQIKMKKQ